MGIHRILMLLAALAVLIAPVGMRQTAAAAPHAAPMAMAGGHCADTEQPDSDHPRPEISCAMACAALPAESAEMPARGALAAPLLSLPILASADGLSPEAEPPPPRFS